MPKELDNLDQFFEILENISQEALTMTGKVVPMAMQEEIKANIYDDHTPSMYERTGQTLRTPRAMVGKGIIYTWYENEGYTWRDGRNKVFPLDKWQDGEVKAPGWNRCKNTYSPVNFIGLLNTNTANTLTISFENLFTKNGIDYDESDSFYNGDYDESGASNLYSIFNTVDGDFFDVNYF